MLELGKDLAGAVHVEAEQVLDPVGVGAAARRRAHLRDPGPDRGRGRVDVDRPRRDPVRVLEQLVAGKPGGRFLVRRPPRQDRSSQEERIHGGQGHYAETCASHTAKHALNANAWLGKRLHAELPNCGKVRRFGYLGSEFPEHAAVAGQADAYVALMDALEIPELPVLAFSAGSSGRSARPSSPRSSHGTRARGGQLAA